MGEDEKGKGMRNLERGRERERDEGERKHLEKTFEKEELIKRFVGLFGDNFIKRIGSDYGELECLMDDLILISQS